MKFVKITAAVSIGVFLAFVSLVATMVRDILKHEAEAEPYEWYDLDPEEDHDPATTTSDATVIDLRGRTFKFDPETHTYKITGDK
jgi:hypothetical protein